MLKFHFRLDRLLEQRRHRRNLCLQLLSQAIADQADVARKRDRLVVERRRHVEEVRLLTGAGTMDVQRWAALGTYAIDLERSAREIDQQSEVVLQQVALCRQSVESAEQGVKVLEKVREKELAEFHLAQQRNDDRTLDDLYLSSRHRA